MASLRFHAAAIQAAIYAAADDNCFLDGGEGNPMYSTVDLNQMDEHGELSDWIEITIPEGV